jgi:hypothetical protein
MAPFEVAARETMASFMSVGHANGVMFDPAGAEFGLNTEPSHVSA